MTVYVDLILIQNIIMNYIIILTTGIICKIDIKQYKIICASIIGAIYAIVMYVMKLNIYNNQLVKIVLSVCMVYIAFHSKNFKSLLKQVIIFYLTSFCFGGATYYLLYCISPGLIKYINGTLVGTYPIKIAILGGIVGFFITVISFNVIKNRFEQKDLLYNVKIYYKEKNIGIKVILDTGNLLTEPITNTPVMIVEASKMKTFIPDNILKNMDEILNNNVFNEITEEMQSRFCIIPFSTVGKQNGIIVGFRPDYIKIYTDQGEEIRKKIVIGIYNNAISKNGLYSGLMGLNLLENDLRTGDLNEYNSNIKV